MDLDRRRARYYGILRVCTVLLSLGLQIVLVAGLIFYLRQYAGGIYLVIELLSIIVVFGLVNEDNYNRQFWIVIIMVLPGFGFLLYYLWGSQRKDRKLHKRLLDIELDMKAHLIQSPEVADEFEAAYPNKVQISRYLQRDNFPVYKDTDVTYYPLGDLMEPDFMKDLEKAKESIFMEYFIVYNGEWWKRIEEVLIKKAAEGVDVRLLVDDFGCLYMGVRKLKKQLKEKGIKLCSFAPLEQRIGSLSFNYRNHQKITVIDSTIAYTGGINLADEYINQLDRFGHWKDTAIRMEGAAVYSMTATFMEMWKQVNTNPVNANPVSVDSVSSGVIRGNDNALTLEQLMPRWETKGKGFVQPFAGGPHRNPNNPICGTYCRLINKAREYVYITTPYLVLDYHLRDQLFQAVESGVDVRIITPHHYDKWYVYMVTVSNYGKLLEKGVRIFEYTPGFIHAKNVVVDDECAVCGTVNLDYRSMYLHHENGVFIARDQAVLDIKNDFLETLNKCNEIRYDQWKKRPLFQKMVQGILKVLSPLL